MMTIYNDPKLYAETTHITLEQAEIRCAHFKQLEAKRYETSKCPECGKHTLEIEGGSYEEGIKEYVYCDNDNVTFIDEDKEISFTDCGFSSPVVKEYEPLKNDDDFDVVLAYADFMDNQGLEQAEKHMGFRSWTAFVEDSNKRLLI